MSLTKLMEISVGNVIDKRMQLFIYDMICLSDATDEDIATIKAYEDPNDKDKHRVIDEMIKSCKLFKAKHVLMKKDMPPVENVKIVITRVEGQINPKVVLEAVNYIATGGTKQSDDTADALSYPGIVDIDSNIP